MLPHRCTLDTQDPHISYTKVTHWLHLVHFSRMLVTRQLHCVCTVYTPLTYQIHHSYTTTTQQLDSSYTAATLQLDTSCTIATQQVHRSYTFEMHQFQSSKNKYNSYYTSALSVAMEVADRHSRVTLIGQSVKQCTSPVSTKPVPLIKTYKNSMKFCYILSMYQQHTTYQC